MFRRKTEYIPVRVEVGPTSTHVTKTVHEHRAPTDESVKLLREMEAAARSNILEQIRLDDNEIKCVVEIFRDWESYENVFYVAMSINGKRIVVKKSISGNPNVDKFAKIASLVDEVAKAIAVESLEASFSKLDFSSL